MTIAELATLDIDLRAGKPGIIEPLERSNGSKGYTTLKQITHLMIALLTAALLLTACGGQQQITENAAEPTEAPAADAPTEAVEPTQVPTADEETTTEEDAISADGCDDGLRQVDHELLVEPLCIPENPERIVTLDIAALELMLMLDIAPVARDTDDFFQAIYGSAPAVYDRVMAIVGDVPVVGGYTELNIEMLVQMQPDLLIISPGTTVIDELREFTTVVEPTMQTGSWSQMTEFYAEVLGVTEEYEQMMTEYEARITTFVELRDPAFDGASLVYVQDSGGNNYVGLPGLPLWETLSDVGFVPVETLPKTQEEAMEEFGALAIPLSEEQVPLLDSDVIILSNGNVTRESREAADELIVTYQEDPLWQTLSAVQNDLLIPTSVYWQSVGFVSTHAVIDDLFTYFTDVNPAEVSPNPFLSE